MTFKQNWEKTESQHKLPDDVIEGITHSSINDEVESYSIVSGGCANLNIKIKLKSNNPSLLLRIYLRDKDVAYREWKISKILQNKIPVPQIYSVNDFGKYRFAICEFIEGITLRELLLSNRKFSIHSIMYRCGLMLAQISKVRFSKAGFFDKNINVVNEFSADEFISYVQNCLEQKFVRQQLGPKMILQIENLFIKKKNLLPNNDEKHLVHADFDPSNILVREIDKSWQIVSVLDWEFAFSGSILYDVANMLRYAHHMPSEFKNSFIEGLTDSGIFLPENWNITINLLNLGSLLDCLARSDPERRPNQCQDIKMLIKEIIK